MTRKSWMTSSGCRRARYRRLLAKRSAERAFSHDYPQRLQTVSCFCLSRGANRAVFPLQPRPWSIISVNGGYRLCSEYNQSSPPACSDTSFKLRPLFEYHFSLPEWVVYRVFCNETATAARTALLVSSSPAIAWEPGDDWRDDQCEYVIDGANRVADVCRGIYGRGEIFLGIYWRDGAEVIGPCNATESWPIEYQGLSRSDAYDWLVEYCNWWSLEQLFPMELTPEKTSTSWRERSYKDLES